MQEGDTNVGGGDLLNKQGSRERRHQLGDTWVKTEEAGGVTQAEATASANVLRGRRAPCSRKDKEAGVNGRTGGRLKTGGQTG